MKQMAFPLYTIPNDDQAELFLDGNLESTERKSTSCHIRAYFSARLTGTPLMV